MRQDPMIQKSDPDIVAESLRAIQAIYFAWQLEQMRAFQVVERLSELFAQGLLPIGPGPTRRLLSTYSFSKDRLSLAERSSLYVGTLGAPGGSPDEPQPNREFPSLWLRFMANSGAARSDLRQYAGRRSKRCRACRSMARCAGSGAQRLCTQQRTFGRGPKTRCRCQPPSQRPASPRDSERLRRPRHVAGDRPCVAQRVWRGCQRSTVPVACRVGKQDLRLVGPT